MEKLYQTVQKQIFHRNKTTDFQIGIGSIVNGYGDLKKSFKDSKKIIDYMDMLRYLYGDKNISVADFSKLGFFQIFEKIKNRDELMEYVPESLVKLYWYFNFSISFGVQSKNSQSFASIVKSILVTLFLQ